MPHNLLDEFRIPYYETIDQLYQYMLFHYGSDQDQLPYAFGPTTSINFPSRCVTECLDVAALPNSSTALDIGCAVGRSSFELARHCEKVIGVDTSQSFILAAQGIQCLGKLEYSIINEGAQIAKRVARLPEGVMANRVEFICCDIMDYEQKPILFNVVLAANVLCRVKNPRAFLALLSRLVAPQGQLILTSPYSWLENFTPESHWLKGKSGRNEKSSLELIQAEFKDSFELKRSFDLPFLMREHLRKYQWGIAQASIWKRNP